MSLFFIFWSIRTTSSNESCQNALLNIVFVLTKGSVYPHLGERPSQVGDMQSFEMSGNHLWNWGETQGPEDPSGGTQSNQQAACPGWVSLFVLLHFCICSIQSVLWSKVELAVSVVKDCSLLPDLLLPSQCCMWAQRGNNAPTMPFRAVQILSLIN